MNRTPFWREEAIYCKAEWKASSKVLLRETEPPKQKFQETLRANGRLTRRLGNASHTPQRGRLFKKLLTQRPETSKMRIDFHFWRSGNLFLRVLLPQLQSSAKIIS